MRDTSGCTHTSATPSSRHKRWTCIHRDPVGSHATVTRDIPAAAAAVIASATGPPSWCAPHRAVRRHSTRMS
jgi:hypothetical protein